MMMRQEAKAKGIADFTEEACRRPLIAAYRLGCSAPAQLTACVRPDVPPMRLPPTSDSKPSRRDL